MDRQVPGLDGFQWMDEEIIFAHHGFFWRIETGKPAIYSHYNLLLLTTILALDASAGSAPAVAGLRSKEAGAAPLQG